MSMPTSTDREELQARKAAAEAFAREHMVACVREAIEWRRTGILRDGRVRELANLCAGFMGTKNALDGAERVLQMVVYEYVAAE